MVFSHFMPLSVLAVMMGTISKGADHPGPMLLGIYEEAVGVLHALEHDGGSLIARIGPVTVVLPAELEAELRPRIGQKVGVIKTDDLARPYRVRVCHKAEA